MIIDVRSFKDKKHLKIAYLKALANTFGGKIEVSLGDKLKKNGMNVYEGEIQLTLPKNKRKEAKKQLKTLGIKRLNNQDNIETYLRPSTIARLMAKHVGNPIGKSDDGRWILCPQSRILTDEEAFIPFITEYGCWITTWRTDLPSKFGFGEKYKFPFTRVPKPLHEWSKKVATVYDKLKYANDLRKRINRQENNGESLLQDEERVLGGEARQLFDRLKTFISFESQDSPRTLVDASGLGGSDFLALLITALLAKGMLIISSDFVWREEVTKLIAKRRNLIWAAPSVSGAGKFFDVRIYKQASTYVMERRIDIGRETATLKEQFTPIWEIFKGEE